MPFSANCCPSTILLMPRARQFTGMPVWRLSWSRLRSKFSRAPRYFVASSAKFLKKLTTASATCSLSRASFRCTASCAAFSARSSFIVLRVFCAREPSSLRTPARAMRPSHWANFARTFSLDCDSSSSRRSLAMAILLAFASPDSLRRLLRCEGEKDARCAKFMLRLTIVPSPTGRSSSEQLSSSGKSGSSVSGGSGPSIFRA